MMPVLFLSTPRRYRLRAAVVAGALVAGLGTVLTSTSASAATPEGYPLPVARTADVVVDASHRRIFVADPVKNKVVAVGYDGSILGTAGKLPGVNGLALSPDESTLYAAVVDADAIVAIDTESVRETARFSTGANSDPTYLAAGGGKIWFGYGEPDGFGGGLGSLDPAIGESSVTLTHQTGWRNPPIVAATSDRLAVADAYSSSGFVEILDVTGDSPTPIVSENVGPVIIRDLTFTPDGSRLLTVTHENRVNSWKTSDLSLSTSYTMGGQPSAVAVAPDGRLAVGSSSADDDPRVHVYLPGTTAPVRRFTLASTSPSVFVQDDITVGGLIWEPNGTRLFAISTAYPDTYRLVVLTDPTLSEPVLTVSVPATAVRAKAITVTGRLTASLPLPAGTGVSVTRIDGESPKGKSLGMKTVNSAGRLAFKDTPKAGGKLTYRLRYAGDATHTSVSATGAVSVRKDAPGLTLKANRKTYAYGSKATFTAKLGKAYKNRMVEFWADPAGADKKKRLIRKAVANSKGTVKATLKLTRNTAVTAVYRGDTRTTGKTVKTSVSTKVRITTSVAKHYRTKKIGSTKYYVFHKTKDPIFTTMMTAAPGRAQRFTIEYYFDGSWQTNVIDHFTLAGNGKSKITVVGTHLPNLKLRVRSAYMRGESGDKLNATTIGPWRNFIFTD
jgi:hypothetical protein